jgi:hypothetical protein
MSQHCNTCNQTKPSSAFYECTKTKCMDCKKRGKNARITDRLTDYCHSCHEWKAKMQFPMNARGDERLRTCEICRDKKLKLQALALERPAYVPLPAGLPTHQNPLAWYLHTGRICLYIIGPGPLAMHRCSESYYRGEVGSEEERRVANLAILQLNRELDQNMYAGPEVIKVALANVLRS